ncbi:glycosyltransferase involved in cell wall biosynthesis [Neorhizobium galegae]|uniref:glycosyltransferase family 2 protein n=1 Tax=Neorhizobium galegae TaxID=399 RepID=UPI001AE86255|nr:glycosyltransferase family 2 protein [Neorhizobium galegae]MBP2548063.1 glycosyltransferase involved in cell wall biosynthesis [Neorhizobium galegae]
MSVTSVIIPAYNACQKLDRALQSVLSNDSVLEVIVVDDCSTDATSDVVSAWTMRTPRVRLVRQPMNGGAGAARTAGLQASRGRYLYFLDADDLLLPGAIDTATEAIAQTGADVVAFRYGLVEDAMSPVHPMQPIDTNIWSALCGASPLRVLGLDEGGRILTTVNYPWNKIIDAAHYKANGLYFSNTRVHNDVYAHWHIYLNARRIGLLNRHLINHVGAPGNAQLSNNFTRQRFDIFQALDEVEALFAARPDVRARHYVWFLAFKLDILNWISWNLQPELHPEFIRRIEQNLAGYGDQDYLAAYLQDKQTAVLSLYLRHNAGSVLAPPRQAA